MKKGAIGISVNLLVVIIISLVIFGGAMTLLFKLVGGAEEKKAELDAQTQMQLERLLMDQGKKVALPRNSATLYRDESYIFGVGILNIKTEPDTFKVTVDLSKAVDSENNDITDLVEWESWLLYSKESFELKNNEHQSVPIMVIVAKDAPKGTYIFNVNVIEGSTGDNYDNVKKFTVAVK